MARETARPIVFPLSNPTASVEAKPQDILPGPKDGQFVGTGSPFLPVEYNGRRIKIDQTNTSYTFPGIALGVLAVKAPRISDNMLEAAALALAASSPAKRDANATLLPPVEDLRKVAVVVARSRRAA